jgi:hypothetical protein
MPLLHSVSDMKCCYCSGHTTVHWGFAEMPTVLPNLVLKNVLHEHECTYNSMYQHEHTYNTVCINMNIL